MADNQRHQGTGGQQGDQKQGGGRQDKQGDQTFTEQGDRDRTMGREREQGKGTGQGQGQGGQGQGGQRQQDR